MTEIPCCKCGGVVIDEFSVPSELWNAVMRPDGHETDQEYLCFECWNGALNVYITRLRSLVTELKEGITNTRDLARTGVAPDAFGMTQEDWMRHKLIKVSGELDALMSKVDEVMK